MKNIFGIEIAFNCAYRVEFKNCEVVYFKHYGTEIENFNAMNAFCYDHEGIKSIYRNGKDVTAEFIDN